MCEANKAERLLGEILENGGVMNVEQINEAAAILEDDSPDKIAYFTTRRPRLVRYDDQRTEDQKPDCDRFVA